MKTVQQLRQERQKLIADARAMLDKAEQEKRDLSDEESTQYDGLLAQADTLLTKINREERLQGLEAEMRSPANGGLRPVPADAANIGMNSREVQRYSVLKALNALVTGNWRGAEFEREASEAVAKRLGREPQGVFMPYDVLSKRDLTVGTNSAGGYTVSTDLLSGSFIEMLRNSLVLNRAGATTLAGLVGNIAIPRQTGGATAYWVAESGAPTESAQAFDQIAMTPKTVGAFSDISRKLLLQSSIDVENFVQRDLATTIALAIDLAGLHGTGSSNQPTGIAATSGIGSVVGGTNGAAPDWDDLVDLETALATANADVGRMAYITNAKVRGKLKKTAIESGYPDKIWDVKAGSTPLNGYQALVSNQVSSALTKGTSSGVCSAIFFGNWADLIIGLWGGLDLMVDPYTGSTSGTVRVVALQDVDIAVRHAASFAAMLDALTS